MANIKKEPIFGYIDLTENFRKWLMDQYLNHNKRHYAAGWRVIPAHYRTNPIHDIIVKGYPDVSDAHMYWFDNPDKRDENNEIERLPLPIHSVRDREFFNKENSKFKNALGFNRYVILESRRRLISEFQPDKSYAEQVTKRVMADAVEVPMETPSFVAHPEGGLPGGDVFSAEVIAEAKKIVENKTKKRGRPKKSKTETRLQTV